MIVLIPDYCFSIYFVMEKCQNLRKLIEHRGLTGLCSLMPLNCGLPSVLYLID